jgi:hypothetical protein
LLKRFNTEVWIVKIGLDKPNLFFVLSVQDSMRLYLLYSLNSKVVAQSLQGKITE